MKDNHRDQYLRQEWSAYPQAPMTTLSVARARLKSAGKEDFWLGGEVVEVSDTALKIAAQGETQAWKNLKVELASILRPGDKVAVRQSGGELRVILLAPALREQARSALKVGVARQWQEFLGKIRAHFQQEGYLEVQTPSLVPCPGFEPTLEPFFVELKKGRSLQKLFLPTSPELHLKRLLSQGWSEIFEIRSCFRNNEF